MIQYLDKKSKQFIKDDKQKECKMSVIALENGLFLQEYRTEHFIVR